MSSVNTTQTPRDAATVDACTPNEIGKEPPVPEPPSLSIITINRNDHDGLKRTLRSVEEQTVAPLEVIVIDGASTDGSVELLQNSPYPWLTWISEPDSGIYNAMNKGVRHARGEYLLFLNSGDHLCSPVALELAIPLIGEADIYNFDTVIRDQPAPHTTSESYWRSPDDLSIGFFLSGSLFHASTFFRADVFHRVGLYDENLRIVSDWKLMLVAIIKHQCTYKGQHHPVGVFYKDGISCSPDHETLHAAERYTVIKSEIVSRYPELAADIETLIHGSKALESVQALRNSRVIQLLQRLKLLWEF